MKNLKYFENFQENKDWKIGDILIALETRYIYAGNWIEKGHKYKLIDIDLDSFRFNVEPRIQIQNLENNIIYIPFVKKDYFMLLDDWELKINIKNFNI